MTIACANILMSKVETNILNRKKCVKTARLEMLHRRHLGISAHDLFEPDGNRKSAASLFNLSSHYHVYIVKYLSLVETVSLKIW